MEPVMARDEEDKAQWKDEGGTPSAEMPPRGGKGRFSAGKSTGVMETFLV